MQLSLRITAYAERLLNDLDSLDWSDSLKAIQRNWIGRSEGAQLFFAIADSSKKLEIYTTRPDTIFGVTFMVIAPEHPLLDELTTTAQRPEIDKYLEYAKARSERERQSDVKHVTGAFTGSYCIHPFTGEQIPIWTSEYVLAGYGTGAIMAVPADDERDQRFAQHFHLPIIDIIDKSAYPHATIEDKLGKMIQSDFLNGMAVLDAIRKVNEIMEERKIGKRRINFKMRDVIFSRQRYWGEPMPIKYDKDGVAHPETNLPLELPAMDDFKPTGSIKGPLSKATDWVNTPDGMQRETDTMPGFAGSSWYYLRYMDAQNKQNPFSQEAVNYWKNVDLYLGGQEHATGHLLYARLFHKFLYDKGLVPTIEPFQKLINQGMIQGVIERILRLNEKQNGRYVYICASLASQYKEAYTTVSIHTKLVDDYDVSTPSYLSLAGILEFIKWRPENEGALFLFPNGQYDTASQEWSSNDGTDANQVRFYTQSEIGKMSKRYFNVVNPDDMIARYGTDCFRLYEMFLGPLEQSKPWNTNGIEGVSKFLRKLWSLFYDNLKGAISLENTSPSAKEWKVLHQTIKKVRHDLDRFSFNTCVSHFMIAVNDLKDLKCKNALILQDLIVLISPFAPHIAEELYKNALQNEGSVLFAALPEHNELYLVESEIEYPIQINGKLRGHVAYPADTSVSEIEKTVIEQEIVQRWAEGKTIKKIIVVPTKMINIVIV
jgi:leucyl-tRNA synthetase